MTGNGDENGGGGGKSGAPDPGAVELQPTSDTADHSDLASLQFSHQLYEALVAEELARFSHLLEHAAEHPAAIDHCHGDGYTCLQYACDHRLAEFVEALLTAGADPGVASAASGRTALHFAAARDHHLLRRLLAHAPHLDVNVADDVGLTPLHHAVHNGNPTAMTVLLQAGADVNVRDSAGRPLLQALPVDVLQDYLDSCVTTKGRYVTDVDFDIEFNYALMAAPRGPKSEPHFEMAAVWHMSTSKEHRDLLRHPLVESFLDLKWWQVRPFFVVDLICYAVFVALLTALVFVDVESNVAWYDRGDAFLGCYYATAVISTTLTVCKAVQLLCAPTRYCFSDKNDLLKVPVLCMTVTLLYTELSRSEAMQLSAMTMMFAWGGLFALLSRMPIFSVYVKMFTTVLRRFICFLLCYMVLILGFTLSMYIMFKDSGRYRTPGDTLLQTLVMTIDKLDYGSMPLNDEPAPGQLAFVGFLFLITVVLTNLLNGLAVADTADIRNQARVFSSISRIELLAYTESMMLDGPLQFLGDFPCPMMKRCLRRDSACIRCFAVIGRACGLRAWFARRLRLTNVLPDLRLHMFPNQPERQVQPRLPRFWSFRSKLAARARAVALQRTGRHVDLGQRLSLTERRLNRQLSSDDGP